MKATARINYERSILPETILGENIRILSVLIFVCFMI